MHAPPTTGMRRTELRRQPVEHEGAGCIADTQRAILRRTIRGHDGPRPPRNAISGMVVHRPRAPAHCPSSGGRAGRHRPRRREFALAVGTAVRRPPAHHRHRPAAVSPHLARPLRQARLHVERADDRAARRDLWRADSARCVRARDAGRIHGLHRAAVCALRCGRRHPDHRQSARDAAGQRHDPECRRIVGQHRRHDRRGDDPPPAAHSRQFVTAAQRPRLRVLYFSGGEHRRCTNADRRSAAVRRLPARRRLLLDDAQHAGRNRGGRRPRADDLPADRSLVLPPGSPGHDRRRVSGADEPQGHRNRQPSADGRDHRRRPDVRHLAARDRLRRVRHRARSAEVSCATACSCCWRSCRWC